MYRALACCVVAALVATSAIADMGFSACARHFVEIVPAAPVNGVRICREGVVAIAYDTIMQNPAWSAYSVTPDDLTRTFSGRIDFYVDPDLTAMGVAHPSPRSPAFDRNWTRGHLAPNHILSYSEIGKKASFTMANVAPQEEDFNRGPWNELEQKVFEWAKINNPLHIVTGVAYSDRAHPFRRSGVAVPDFFWKVLCDPANGQSVGFIGENRRLPNQKVSSEMQSVMSVEQLYGGLILPGDSCRTSQFQSNWWWSSSGVIARVRGLPSPPPPWQLQPQPLPPSPTSVPPKAGDDEGSGAFAFLTLVIGLCVIAWVIIKKKAHNNNNNNNNEAKTDAPPRSADTELELPRDEPPQRAEDARDNHKASSAQNQNETAAEQYSV